MPEDATTPTLGDMVIGTRLMIRSRTDWRTAVVSRVTEESITLSIASPTGRNYRLRRAATEQIDCQTAIPVIYTPIEENWLDNFAKYDSRW